MKYVSILLLMLGLAMACSPVSHEYHVAKEGKDSNPGSEQSPFLTIGKAAEMAQAGDVIIVHEGIYREEINPPRGGTSDEYRITYRAAEGESIEIRGSEVVDHWEKLEDGIWKAVVENSLFGDFNPFADEVSGNWFNPQGRKHHTGCVYLDGAWLFEAESMDSLLAGRPMSFFATVEEDATILWADFGEQDPRQLLTEINVRQTVFYPRKPFVNYITVSGFKLRHAAPAWAPPTAEQMGLIGTHWSKGWVIENNEISHSINVGISLGKYGDEFDNLEASAAAYLSSIDRARQHGWNRDAIGSHLVRNNEISYCEQAGIVGSMGASFSIVEENYIHHIHTQRRFGGAEMAAIKFHAPIDMLIKDNHIHDGFMGIWLDWMTQGTRVTGNLLYRNTAHDIYSEVNHGPYVIDNNICLSDNCRHLSQGGAFAHNLFAGKWGNWDNGRETPYFKAHSTEKIGDHHLFVGDDRFYNNMFIGNGGEALYITEQTNEGVPFYYSYGLRCYEYRPMLPETGGNVYYHGAEPCEGEQATVLDTDPGIELEEAGDELYLRFTVSKEHLHIGSPLVNTELLGLALVPQAPFENFDGTELRIDTDYFGLPRKVEQPTSGPFESLQIGLNRIKVWPKD